MVLGPIQICLLLLLLLKRTKIKNRLHWKSDPRATPWRKSCTKSATSNPPSVQPSDFPLSLRPGLGPAMKALRWYAPSGERERRRGEPWTAVTWRGDRKRGRVYPSLSRHCHERRPSLHLSALFCWPFILSFTICSVLQCTRSRLDVRYQTGGVNTNPDQLSCPDSGRDGQFVHVGPKLFSHAYFN